MRDIDFERRFDLGTNNSLRRLAPNLRVDRQTNTRKIIKI